MTEVAYVSDPAIVRLGSLIQSRNPKTGVSQYDFKMIHNESKDALYQTVWINMLHGQKWFDDCGHDLFMLALKHRRNLCIRFLSLEDAAAVIGRLRAAETADAG